MEFIVDAAHPTRELPASTGGLRDPDAARLVDEADSLGAQRTWPYSFAAECECPDDCLRDHANE